MDNFNYCFGDFEGIIIVDTTQGEKEITNRINSSNNIINLSINISSAALNVTVKNVKEDRIIEEDKIKIIDRGIIKNISEYSAEKEPENRVQWQSPFGY